MRTNWIAIGTLVLMTTVAGCTGLGSGAGETSLPDMDERDMWMPTEDESGLLAFVNDPSVATFDVLDLDCEIRSDSAGYILLHRDGEDGVPFTADDDLFETGQELLDVYMVGPWTMERLVECADDFGYLEDACEPLAFEGDLEQYDATYFWAVEDLGPELAGVVIELMADAQQHADPTVDEPVRFGEVYVFDDGGVEIGARVSFNQMLDLEGGIQLWMWYTLDSCMTVTDLQVGI